MTISKPSPGKQRSRTLEIRRGIGPPTSTSTLLAGTLPEFPALDTTCSPVRGAGSGFSVRGFFTMPWLVAVFIASFPSIVQRIQPGSTGRKLSGNAPQIGT